MNICFLNFEGAPTIEAAVNNRIGGLNTILFNLLKYISLLPGVNTTVVYCKGKSRLVETRDLARCRFAEIKTGSLDLQTNLDFEECLQKFVAGVKDLFCKERFDVVHTSGSEAGIAMHQLRRSGITIPWVHTNYATLAVRRVMLKGMHPSDAVSDKVGQRELLCLKSCDHVIALSETDKQEIREVFQISDHKISVAQPGIDRGIFYPPIKKGTKRKPVVVSAGRMSHIKDFPFLIKSFQLLCKISSIKGLKLIIVGGNDLERRYLGLPSLAKELGVYDKVNFQDGASQKTLAEHFRSAMAFAGTSMHETFGLLPVEARACGTPFVVRSNSSYLATAADGDGGYFSDNNSEADMAEKLSRILSLNGDEWLKMSNDAIQSTERFRWPVTAKTCFAVYKRLALQEIK